MTIIEHREKRKRYILLGGGFGMYQSKKPNFLFGDLLADIDEGHEKLVCASDKEGNIVWLKSSMVRVVSVDEKSPMDVLKYFS